MKPNQSQMTLIALGVAVMILSPFMALLLTIPITRFYCDVLPNQTECGGWGGAGAFVAVGIFITSIAIGFGFISWALALKRRPKNKTQKSLKK